MSYLLYFSPDSANIVVRMVLEELGVEYESRRVPDNRSDRDDEFFALNPRGLLPVLIDGEADATLFETGAIILYLADKHQTLAPGHQEPAARAECLRWLFLLSNTLHADLVRNFYSERFADDARTARGVKETAAKRVGDHLALIDQHIELSDGDWFLSSGLSICDFYLGACVRWAQLYPEGDPALTATDVHRFEALSTLLDRTQELPSVQVAMEKERIGGPAFVEPLYPSD
ncbi:MAG: glutathione S-transferase family protein [Pseudomonadota bacterium]